MCRTRTSAQPDDDLAKVLEDRYPRTYQQRREEEEVDHGQRNGQGGAEGIMILIGNRHRAERSAENANQHDWTFFVRLSRPDVVKEVIVYLHPTFRPPIVAIRHPPFEVRRLGWGVFTLEAVITLNEPYVWVRDAESEDSKEDLRLQWTLDFEERGRQGRVRAKIRKEESVHGEGHEGETGIATRTRSGGVGRQQERRSPVRYPHMDPDFET